MMKSGRTTSGCAPQTHRNARTAQDLLFLTVNEFTQPTVSAHVAEAIMVIVMDMSAGKTAVVEPAAYDDEVLNASWLPQPELALQLQEHDHEAARQMPPPEDVEAFLQAVYRNQE
jgi:hypothetical protein